MDIAKKFRTFKKDPVRAGIFKIFAFLRIFSHMWARLRLKRYLRLFKNRASLTPDAFGPDYSDMWFLYKTARRRKPRVVLEFGCGCSTLILAQALKDNGSGYLYSLDCEPHWLEVTKKSMPLYLKEFYELRHSPVIETEYGGVPVFRHGGIPDVTVDMLYLDSPELTEERKVAVDPLDLEERFSDNFYMVVDGRGANVKFLREHLKGSYRVRTNRLLGNSTFERLR